MPKIIRCDDFDFVDETLFITDIGALFPHEQEYEAGDLIEHVVWSIFETDRSWTFMYEITTPGKYEELPKK